MGQWKIEYGWWAVGIALLQSSVAAGQAEPAAEPAPSVAISEASTEAASTESSGKSGWTYPKTYSVRPLTMQRGMVRANGIFTIWDDGVDTIFGMTLGASVGVTDDLELGINNYRIGSSLQQRYEGLVPVIFAPSSAAGFGNIPVYGRYRFLRRGKLELAGDLIFVLPTDTAFALEGAFPLRIKPNDALSVDTGLEVRGTFGSNKRADIRIPAIVNYNFSERAFIAVETGVQFVNLGSDVDAPATDGEGVAFPLGFRAGGTWKKKDVHLIDLFAGFAFPALIETGTSRKTVEFGIWDIFVGVAFYTRPLF
jgi:hypothetical protein